MRSNYVFISGLLFVLILLTACGHSLNRYYIQSDSPKIILVDDMLNNVEMFKEIDKAQMPPIEFWDKDGNRRCGKLVQITRNNIVYSIGNYYKFDNDSLNIIEEIKTVPKENIIIFKMW